MSYRESYEWRDVSAGRNVARLVKHGDDIYIETEGNHDGVLVMTAVKIPRAAFAHGIKHIGGILP